MALPDKNDLDQSNRIRSPEINSHIYSQLIFDKGAKNILLFCILRKYIWKKNFQGDTVLFLKHKNTTFYVLVTYSMSIYTFLKGFKMVSKNLGSI